MRRMPVIASPLNRIEPALGRTVPGNRIQDRALAGAVRTDHRDDFPAATDSDTPWTAAILP